MAATLGKGYTFGATESVTNAKLHALVDGGTVSGISNSDIAADAAIDSSKINFTLSDYVTVAGDQTIGGTKTFTDTQIFSTPLANTNIAAITQASKVSGTSFYALASCVSGAGQLPRANQALQDIDALLPAQGSASGKFLTTNGSASSWGSVGSGNVLFAWAGNVDSDVTTYLSDDYDGGGTGSVTIAYSYRSVRPASPNFGKLFAFKVVKTAGINTISLLLQGWAFNSDDVALKLEMGTESVSANVSGGTNRNPTWFTPLSLDVSGLTNGTTYDLNIYARGRTNGYAIGCSAVLVTVTN